MNRFGLLAWGVHFLSLLVIHGYAQESPSIELTARSKIDNPPSYYAGTFLHGSTLILACGCYEVTSNLQSYSGLILFDIADPDNMHEISRYQSEHTGVHIIDDGPTYGAQMQWPYVYLPSENQMEIIDISDPSIPILVGRYPGIQGGLVRVNGNKAILAARYSQKIEIVDISDPSNPLKLGSIAIPVRIVMNLMWDGGEYAYLLMFDGDHTWESMFRPILFAVLDCSDPSQPNLVSTTEMLKAQNLFQLDGRLYVTTAPEGYSQPYSLNVFSLSNPSSPVLAANYAVPYLLGKLIPVDRYYIGYDGYKGGIGIYEMDGMLIEQVYLKNLERPSTAPVWNGQYLLAVNPIEHFLHAYNVNFPSSSSFFELYE